MSDVSENWYDLTIFRKITTFHENLSSYSSVVPCLRTDGQTEREKQALSTVVNTPKRIKNGDSKHKQNKLYDTQYLPITWTAVCTVTLARIQRKSNDISGYISTEKLHFYIGLCWIRRLKFHILLRHTYLLTYLFTDLLTYLRSWAFLEKLQIMQLLKNFPAF
jgi:hypothetical protein